MPDPLSTLAYIGPGAGFAVRCRRSWSCLVTFAAGIPRRFLLWPIKAAVKSGSLIFKKRPPKTDVDSRRRGRARRLRPESARRKFTTKRGNSRNFQKLAEQEVVRHATAVPSIPGDVARGVVDSFATGVDASRHNIYDFLTRDPCATYMPGRCRRTDTRTRCRASLNLGLRQGPFRPARGLQDPPASRQPFWKLLGANTRVVVDRARADHVPAAEVQERHAALRHVRARPAGNSQGSFSFYTTDEAKLGLGDRRSAFPRRARGERHRVEPHRARTRQGQAPDEVPVPGRDRRREGRARSPPGGRSKVTCEVGLREYTPWLRTPCPVRREASRGIARFYVYSAGTRSTSSSTCHADQHRPGNAGDADQPSVRLLDLPRQDAGQVRDARPRRGHVGAQRAGDRREGVPGSGVPRSSTSARSSSSTVLDKTKKGFVTVVFDTTDRVQPHVLPLRSSRTIRPTRRSTSDGPRPPSSRRDPENSTRARTSSSATRDGEDRRRSGHRADGHLRPRILLVPARREPQRVAARRGLPRPEGRRRDLGRLVRDRSTGSARRRSRSA